MYYEEYCEYSDDDNDNAYSEYSPEILAEFQYDYKISVVEFYKELLKKEPEFIGIKNISCGKILEILESNNDNKKKLSKHKVYSLNTEQNNIFYNLYKDLGFKGDVNIYNEVTNKIFNHIYI